MRIKQIEKVVKSDKYMFRVCLDKVNDDLELSGKQINDYHQFKEEVLCRFGRIFELPEAENCYHKQSVWRKHINSFIKKIEDNE